KGIDRFAKIAQFASISDKDIIRKSKEKDLFITTDKDFIIKAFPFKHKNGTAVIPIPDLTLVYFHNAYKQNKDRIEVEKKLLDKLTHDKPSFGEDATNEIYQYYGSASGCIISLFTSLESFINHILPDKELYILETDKSTITYNKKQIQKHINFDDKMKKVLPKLLEGKNFFSNSTPFTQHITNLKNLRDDLIHTKSDLSFKNQEDLIKQLLRFKYEECFKAITKFMNFYRENYIIECDCNSEY
ncbi:hypothetical protein, partial [Flavobacterium sp.]|uniref:hypothetical protein n=1 Tax=Flavobacterium sp. TaxID=239 RepID=UPI002B55D17B